MKIYNNLEVDIKYVSMLKLDSNLIMRRFKLNQKYFNGFVVFSMCVYVHACVHCCVCRYVCMCGDSRLTSGVFLALFPLYILRQPEPRAPQLG